ncbi:MAG: C25 family cysteine peptidase [Acidobacteriota bacterium]|nr:C25 family cysteine peptidase [Acidobacteriota bacterium]
MRSILLPSFRHGLIAALTLLVFAPPAQGGIFGGCIDDVTQGIRPNQVPNNCTANDVTFTVVGLGTQDDGCVGPGDTLSIFLGAQVRNTTAQTRYDVGLYVATDGDPNLDGARTGSCYREILTPLGGLGQSACPPLDLDGGAGPFLDTDGDTCGDLLDESEIDCDENMDGSRDDSFLVFSDAVTLPCEDQTGDGFVEIATGSTWGQNNDDVGDPTCDGEFEVIPGTKAKCKLETLSSDVPVADLGLTCSCDRTMVAPTESTSCTITYTNNKTCTPDPGTTERFRCGTASFLRFEVDYDEANGSISGQSATRGSLSDDSSILTWIPASAATMAPGIIGPNGETATLTFDYTIASGTPQGTNITLATSTYWSNTSPSDPAAVEQTMLSCSLGIETTPVTLAWISAQRDGDDLVVEWSTATESRNLGFHLYGADQAPGRESVRRLAGETQLGERLTGELVPSRLGDSTQPQEYRWRLDDFSGDRFFLEDVDASGKSRVHGPFEVGKVHGARPRPQAVEWNRVQQAARAAQRNDLRFGGAAVRGGPAPAAAPIHLQVTGDGFFRVSYEELAAAGHDLAGVAAKDLALSHGGEPVARQVEGGPRFGPGSVIRFFGQGIDSLYTDTNVYRLTAETNAGLDLAVDRSPVPQRGAAPEWYWESHRGGDDRLYAFSSPTGDPWYDTRMLTFQTPRSWSFDLPVEDLARDVTGAAPAARLSLSLWGVTDWPESPDHHLRVLVNGTVVADETFDGFGALPLAVEVPAALLTEGINSLEIELPGDTGALADLINLDGFTLDYPRRLVARADGLRFAAAGERITVSGLSSSDFAVYRLGADGPERVQRVDFEAGTSGPSSGFSATFAGTAAASEYRVVPAGGEAVAGIRTGNLPAGLDEGPAELLIVSHPLFLQALEPLADARRTEGLSVKAVDAFDLYEEWSHGVVDPQAIRDYIAFAADALGTRYVLLVGADTYDYHDRLGFGSVSLLPTLYEATGEVVRFAPVDPLYGDLDGDRVPDLAVGRMPVRTVAELETLLGKTFAYEQKDYSRSLVAAADRFDTGARISFASDSEDFLGGLPDDWSARRAYVDNLGVTGARQRLVDGIEAGAALTSYVGHSGPSAWTFSGLFSGTEAEALTNADRPTVVLQWGCWNTYYVEPEVDTLGHVLLLDGDHGAAAVLGSSTLMDSASTRALGRFLAPRIAQPGQRIGDALTAAKQDLAVTEPERLDVLLGWTLLGDPTLVVDP